jgi:hypothetical protein
MFLGLPDPDPFVRGPYPDPSIIKKNSKKSIPTVKYCFVTFLSNYILSKSYKQNKFRKIILVVILKVADENRLIRIRRQIRNR